VTGPTTVGTTRTSPTSPALVCRCLLYLEARLAHMDQDATARFHVVEQTLVISKFLQPESHLGKVLSEQRPLENTQRGGDNSYTT
jgi:hypothetical protein